MNYNFNIAIGDYVKTTKEEVGYIEKIELYKGNESVRHRRFMTIRFSAEKVLRLEYTNIGVFAHNDFYKLEDYFKQVGKYKFSINKNKIEILPHTKKFTVGGETIVRRTDEYDIIEKINEVINYINR